MTRLALMLFAVWLAGCTWEPRPIFFTPTPRARATLDLYPEVTSPPTQTPTPSATPEREMVSVRVCTGYPRGALNVRACPGTECAVRFILSEGMEVTPSVKTVRVGESTWVHLAGPVQGWVNGRYLCQEGTK